MTTKINKKVAIMGFIAILAMGTTIGTAAAIEPLSLPSNLIEIGEKVNEIITEFNNRVEAIENSIDNIHEHSFIRDDFILGEIINNEQISAVCNSGEIAIGGGYGLADPGLRVIVVQNDPLGYSITIKGTVTPSNAGAGVTVICLPIP